MDLRKRLFAILMSITMVLTYMPAMVFAATEEPAAIDVPAAEEAAQNSEEEVVSDTDVQEPVQEEESVVDDSDMINNGEGNDANQEETESEDVVPEDSPADENPEYINDEDVEESEKLNGSESEENKADEDLEPVAGSAYSSQGDLGAVDFSLDAESYNNEMDPIYFTTPADGIVNLDIRYTANTSYVDEYYDDEEDDYLPYNADCSYELSEDNITLAITKDGSYYSSFEETFGGKKKDSFVLTAQLEGNKKYRLDLSLSWYPSHIKYSGHIDIRTTATSFSIPEKLDLTYGIKKTIPVTSVPDGAYAGITWSSSDTSIATVDSKGTVTPKLEGTCEITGTLPSGLEQKCTVNVRPSDLKVVAKTIWGGQSFNNYLQGAKGETTWATSNSKVATVSSTGTIKGRYPGKCNITAVHGGITYTCQVTVKAAITCKGKTIWGGTSFKNSIKGSISKVAWKSSNTKIATVTSAGVIKGKYPGTCYITGTYDNKSYKCKVVVKAAIRYKAKTIWGGKSFTNAIKGSVSRVSWSTSNKKIATVSKTGVIKGVSPGSCTITAKYNGKKYYCKVKVKTALNYKSVLLWKGEKLTLKLYGATGKVKWKSSNSSIVKISKSGKVKAKKTGKATLTAKCKGKTYKCKVKVIYRDPDFLAELWDYRTRDNYFDVKIRNVGSKTLTITSGIKVVNVDYKSFDRKLKLKKKVKIKPYTTKHVRFYVIGNNTWYQYQDYTLYYKFKYDGKTYEGHVWDEDSVYKKGKKYYDTYWSYSEYSNWNSNLDYEDDDDY